MIELRPANCKDLALFWSLRTRAVAQACASHYSAAVLAAWRRIPCASFVALREELYPHRSGIGIPSVHMNKHLNR